MNVLLDMLHKRAEAIYDGPIPNAENYDIWIRHWFATASLMQSEFESQGLHFTANAMAKIITDNQRYCKSWLDDIE